MTSADAIIYTDMPIDSFNRFLGCIFGQAIGDALGLGTEFLDRKKIALWYPNGLTDYSQIVPDEHRKRFQRGHWTDDTDQMLCIAEAIIEDKGQVKATTIAKHFTNWLNGNPVGIGKHTFWVMTDDRFLSDPYSVSKDTWEAGGCDVAPNGAVMRTSVIGLLPEKAQVAVNAETACKVTHWDPLCVGSCVIVSELIHALVYGYPIPTTEELIAIGDEYEPHICAYIEFAEIESIETLGLDRRPGIGYTLRTLAAALWCLFHAQSFEDGLHQVVMQGGDADTNAAVACALLGAKFGMDGIPPRFVEELVGRDQLSDTANRLYETFFEGHE